MNGSLSALMHERRQCDLAQPRLRRGARPVIARAGEAVQRRGHRVVELPHRAHSANARRVEQPWKARGDGERLGLQRHQEVPRVDPIHPLADGDSRGHQVERRRHHGSRSQRILGARSGAPEPVQQRAAAERYSDRMHFGRRIDARADCAEHGADLAMIAGVVGPRQPIGLATASAKVRDHAAPADAGDGAQQRTARNATTIRLRVRETELRAAPGDPGSHRASRSPRNRHQGSRRVRAAARSRDGAAGTATSSGRGRPPASVAIDRQPDRAAPARRRAVPTLPAAQGAAACRCASVRRFS